MGNASIGQPDRRAASRATILVADNSRTLGRLARHRLRMQGVRMLEARDGDTALALVQARLEPFDLVLADLELPVVGARELAETLAQHRPELPVLFMSRDLGDGSLIAMPTTRVPVLQKPFTTDVLARAIRTTIDRSAWLIAAAEREIVRHGQALGRLAAALVESREARAYLRDLIAASRELRRSRTALSVPPPRAGTDRLHARILCIADDDTLRGLMVRVLQGAGHEVAAAADTRAALEFVQGGSPPGWFDLIVTDNLTPSTSGAELLRHVLAGDPDQRCLHVTADAESAFDAELTMAGGIPVLLKPFTPGELIASVEELVHRPGSDA